MADKQEFCIPEDPGTWYAVQMLERVLWVCWGTERNTLLERGEGEYVTVCTMVTHALEHLASTGSIRVRVFEGMMN